MNWRYLVPRMVLVGLLWSFFAFCFDLLLHRGLVATSETATGARTEFDKVETTFVQPSLVIHNGRMGDRHAPASNLFQFDELRLELAGSPLLRKRFVVRDATLTGLRWNTPRNDSGAAPKGRSVWKSLGDARLPAWDLKIGEALKSKSRDLGQAALDDFVRRARAAADPNQLESYRLARDLEVAWPQKFDELTLRIQAIGSRLESIRAQARELGESPVLKKAEALARCHQESQDLLLELQEIRAALQMLPDSARDDFTQLNDAKDRDLARLRTRIERVRLDGDSLSRFLLGEETLRRITNVKEWIEQCRAFAGAIPAEIETQRQRGQEIAFRDLRPAPRWLLENLQVTGETNWGGNPLEYTATLRDVTSEPKLLGRPTRLHLQASGQSAFEVDATFDRTGDIDRDEASLTWRTSTPVSLALGDPESLGVNVSAAATECQAQWLRQGNSLRGEVRLRQTPVRFAVNYRRNGSGETENPETIRTASASDRDFLTSMPPAIVDQASSPSVALGAASDLLSETLANALAELHDLEATVTFSANENEPAHIELQSNLGPTLAASLRADLVDALNVRRDELLIHLEDDLQARSTALRELMGRRYNEALASLDKNDGEIRSLAGLISGGKVDVQALKPVQALQNAATASGLKKVAQGDLTAAPKKLETVRDDVREIRNDVKTLLDARKFIRK